MDIRDVLSKLRMQREGISQGINEVSLGLYASEHLALLLWSRLLEDLVWLASGPKEAHSLIQQGVSPEKIWTPRALIAMAQLPGGSPLPEDLTVQDALDLLGAQIIKVKVEDLS